MRLNKLKAIIIIFFLVTLTLLISDIIGFNSFKKSLKYADLVALVKVGLIEYDGYFCQIIKDFSETKYKSDIAPIMWIDNEIDDFEMNNIAVGDTLFVSLTNLKEDIINDFKFFVFIKKASERSFVAHQGCNSVLVVKNGFVEDYILNDVGIDYERTAEKDEMTIDEIEKLIKDELQHE
jgi:hypothetical protein